MIVTGLRWKKQYNSSRGPFHIITSLRFFRRQPSIDPKAVERKCVFWMEDFRQVILIIPSICLYIYLYTCLHQVLVKVLYFFLCLFLSFLFKFYDQLIFSSSNGSWSTDGCTVLNDSSMLSTVCSCNHLTNFAVLMQYKDIEV